MKGTTDGRIPSPSVNRTPRKLCLRVPSAVRALVTRYVER